MNTIRSIPPRVDRPCSPEIARHHIGQLARDVRNWTRRLPHFVDQEQTIRDIAGAKAEIAYWRRCGGLS